MDHFSHKLTLSLNLSEICLFLRRGIVYPVGMLREITDMQPEFQLTFELTFLTHTLLSLQNFIPTNVRLQVLILIELSLYINQKKKLPCLPWLKKLMGFATGCALVIQNLLFLRTLSLKLFYALNSNAEKTESYSATSTYITRRNRKSLHAHCPVLGSFFVSVVRDISSFIYFIIHYCSISLLLRGISAPQ